ncbi:hypothetical protein H0H92_003755, partial [Tricholoma furcatifolium]
MSSAYSASSPVWNDSSSSPFHFPAPQSSHMSSSSSRFLTSDPIGTFDGSRMRNTDIHYSTEKINISKDHFSSGARDRYENPWTAIKHLESTLSDVLHCNEKMARQVNRLENMVEESFSKVLGLIRTIPSAVSDAITSHSVSKPLSSAQAPQNEPPTDLFSSVNLPLPCLDADDYPDCKYWKKEDYIKERNSRIGYTKHSSDDNGNTMTWYVTDEDGEPVDGDKVDQIRADARALWTLLRDRGIAPQKWNEANLAARTFYEHHICKRHPELSYGDNNWKAHQICTDNYPGWSDTHIPDKMRTKKATKKGKRAASPASPKPMKKLRTERAPEPISKTLQIRDPLATLFNDPTTLASTIIPATASTSTTTTPATSSTTSSVAPAAPSPSLPLAADPAATITPATSSTTSSTSSVAPAAPAAPSPSLPLAAEPAAAIVPASSEPAALAVVPSSEPMTAVVPATTTDATTSITLALDTSSTTVAPSEPRAVNSTLPPAPPLPPVIQPQLDASMTGEAGVTGGQKKGRKVRVGNANNPKSICKREWVKNNPTSDEKAWDAYWDTIRNDSAALQKYKDIADALATKK